MNSFRTWWRAWRLRRLNAAVVRSDNRIANQLRAELLLRDATIKKLEDRLRATEASRDAEAVRIAKEHTRVIEDRDHAIDRLERQLNLARMENELHNAIHLEDVERRMKEAAVFQRQAKGLKDVFQHISE